jgi:polysaccharide deacetylase family protein (PEP-CTERM system associated)
VSEAGEAVFTIDVEDWYHILELDSAPPMSEWGAMPSRVEANFTRLLRILEENHAIATCFFLGWIAERYPELVKLAADGGHEIASHGYSHQLAHRMGPDQFRKDALRSRELLENICGRRVIGFRAAGFSATSETPWFFQQLAEAGYDYDSSVFPALRAHGGDPEAEWGPHEIRCGAGTITEYPVTVVRLLGVPICLFGGGYLRLFPYWLVHQRARRVMRDGRPVVFYVHPREIDPDQPRLAMNLKRRFKTYVNIRGLEDKVRRITAEFQVTSFENYRKAHPLANAERKWPSEG